MQETINNVGAIIDLCLQRGAFKNKQEAADAINTHTKIQQEYNALAGQRDKAVKMLEEANKPKEDIVKKKATVEQSLDALK